MIDTRPRPVSVSTVRTMLAAEPAVRQALMEAGVTGMNADQFEQLVSAVAKRAYREAHKPEGPSREQRRRLKQMAAKAAKEQQ